MNFNSGKKIPGHFRPAEAVPAPISTSIGGIQGWESGRVNQGVRVVENSDPLTYIYCVVLYNVSDPNCDSADDVPVRSA